METSHTHHIYEVVMTDDEMDEDTPGGFADDHGGLERFEVAVITHSHELFNEPGEPPHSHSHMAAPLKAGSYTQDPEEQPAPDIPATGENEP